MTPHILAGKYLVEEEIASGGMGVICRARDRTIDRTVAIKLVHTHLSGDPSFADRFLREAKAMAKLQHQNIATIYEIEEDHGTPFLVMEFCPGDNLRTILRSRAPLPVHEAIHLAAQLASALACAHAHGVIHRDIKPANILVDKTGKAKLTDFGIASALDEAGLTSVGQIIGTPDYMSPEQAQGKTVDGRSDLYSLGVVLFEMLSGKTPYPKSSGTAMLARLAGDHTELDIPFPAHIPPAVQGVVRDLLRRNPVDRIPDAGHLADRLHQIQQSWPPPSMRGKVDNDSGDTVRIQDTVVHNPKATSHSHSALDQVVGAFKTCMSTVRGRFIFGAGIVLVSIIIALALLIDGTDKTSVRDGPPGDPQVLARLKEQLHEQEKVLAEREPRVQDAAAKLDAAPFSMDCPTLNAGLRETYDRYTQALQQVNQTREKLGLSSVVAVHPTALDRECPDAQLQLLIVKFTQAYEHQDLHTLRTLSHMSEARLLNLQSMFRTYKTLTLSLQRISRDDTGVVVTLFIETAVTKSGERVDLSPIAKKLILRVSRQGDDWDKLVW